MSEGNEISRRYKGPGDGTPYVPSWLLDDPAERDDALKACPTCGRVGTRVDYHGAGKRCTACQTLS